VTWVKNYENGFHKVKTIGNISFVVLLTPVEYAILKRSPEIVQHQEVFNTKKEELDDMIYMDLELNLKGGDVVGAVASNQAELQQSLYYFEFNFAKDIKLTTDQDTVACEIFNFVRNYSIGKKRSFLLGFPRKKSFAGKDLTLNIDSEILSVGSVKITFDKNDINKLPILKN
jgi:hypothetical protein